MMWTDSMKVCGHKKAETLPNDEGVETMSENYAVKLMCGAAGSEKSPDPDGGPPHDGLSRVIDYLGLRELLAIERVCKPLREEVQSDTFYWRNIHIDPPLLSYTITDHHLALLTDRARGNLCSLSIVSGWNITNDGLKRVLERNPSLTKLSVSGCSKLKAGRVLEDLKVFNSGARPGIKYLRIAGVMGLTHELYAEFKDLLGVMENKKCSGSSSDHQKPRFYSSEYLSLDDERILDVEVCPKCENVKQVYDCPSETCQVKKNNSEKAWCRGCIMCIPRCTGCGLCLEDRPYEETFCLKNVCLDCLAQLKKHYYNHMILNQQGGLTDYTCWLYS